MARDIAKTAVVTGAGSGLGRELALGWAGQGFKVGLADIDIEGAEQTLEMVRQAGGSGETWRCDVRSLDEVEAMADHFFDAWGKVGILANNAGVADAGFVGDIPIENWARTLETNLWGVIHGCHAFLPRMKKQGGGHIVNTASAAGVINLPEMAPYNVTKAAVISLSETLKVELAPSRIGVTVICPSFFETHLEENTTYTDEWQGEFVHQVFANARMTSEDIAELVLKAVRKNRLYVVPQLSAKVGWLAKRMNQKLFYSVFAAFYRTPLGKPLIMLAAKRGLL